MRAKKDVYVQHDKELANRLRRLSTPIREATSSEQDFKRRRRSDIKDALIKQREAQRHFKDRETKQSTINFYDEEPEAGDPRALTRNFTRKGGHT